MVEENSFPRGGAVSKKVPSLKVEKELDFGVVSKKRKVDKSGQKDKKSAKEKKFTDDDFEANSAEQLNRKTLQEDMLVMGVVSRVDASAGLQVSLPGRLNGFVSITAISNAYNEVLERVANDEDGYFKTLPEMFSTGDQIYCKVTKLSADERFIELSLNPVDLHSGMHFSRINEGMILTGAVVSFEDYGTVIDVGIPNTRCFLPEDKKSKIQLSIGQLVSCRVKKLLKGEGKVTLANLVLELVTEKTVGIEEIVQLDNLFPTSKVTMTILNKLKNGLSGKVMDGFFTGYINEYHLGPGKNVESFEIGQDIEATVLYTMPLSKFVYLTLNQFVPECDRIRHGAIVQNPQTVAVRSGGVILKLGKTMKGLITYKKMKKSNQSKVDKTELAAHYQGNPISKARVLDYSVADDLYICTDDDQVVNEKFFTMDDLEVGKIVLCTVERKEKSGMMVKIGRINGFIYSQHLAHNLQNNKPGTKIKVRVIFKDYERRSAHLTTIPELIKADRTKIIKDLKTIEVGKSYFGLIRNIAKRLAFVDFFNKISGALKIENPQVVIQQKITVGKVIEVFVSKVVDNKVFLELKTSLKMAKVDIGTIRQGTAQSMQEKGIEVKFANGETAMVPSAFVSEFTEIGSELMQSLPEEVGMKTICLDKNLFSLRDVEPFENYPMLSYKLLQSGFILRGYIKRVDNDGLLIQIPLKSGGRLVKILYPMVVMKPDAENVKSLFTLSQVVYVKVLNKNANENTITCSAKLDEVWKGNIYSSAIYLKTYFKELDVILNIIVREAKLTYKIGDSVEAKVAEATDKIILNFGDKFKGQLIGSGKKKLKVGDLMKCTIVWIDETGTIHLSDNSKLAGLKGEDAFLKYNKSPEKGEILFKTNRLYIVLLNSKHLVYVPLRLHTNDFQPILDGREGSCNVVVLNTQGKRKIGIFADVYKEAEKAGALKEKTEKSTRKRTLSDSRSIESESTEVKDEEEPKPKKTKKSIEIEESQPTVKSSSVLANDLLSIPSDFWDMGFGTLNKKEHNTVSEDEEDCISPAKKGPSTRAKEDKIREMENKLTRSSDDPVSVEEFDRLLLGSPSNSLMWIKYIAFYLQTLDLGKARGVARRALKSIDFREQNEILNVWVAFLNLELRYGDKESFEGVFVEALRVNDQFKINMRTIQMLADTKKIEELRKRVNSATKNFKENFQTWPIVATAFYQVGLVEEAKQFLNKALKFLDKHHRKLLNCP